MHLCMQEIAPLVAALPVIPALWSKFRAWLAPAEKPPEQWWVKVYTQSGVWDIHPGPVTFEQSQVIIAGLLRNYPHLAFCAEKVSGG